MKRNEALRVLRDHKPELAAQYGVTRLALFGSMAKYQATEVRQICADPQAGAPKRTCCTLRHHG